MIDAYDLSEKIKKYWAALYPKDSGELSKTKKRIKVCVWTEEGLREVVGVRITDDYIELTLDKE